MKEYKLSRYVNKIFETDGDYCQWGGYYNYSFLSDDGTKLLSNRCSFDGRAIEPGDTVEVGYYDIPSGQWHGLDVSDSFNWPQATMLQWAPGTDNKEVIFNLSKDGHLISRIINIETGEKRDLCYPVYGMTPDGKQSITLNLERSYWTPAYHYQSVANEACNVDILEGDGIFSLDLATDTLKQIVSLEDVLKLKPEDNFLQGKHWLEHIMVSPSGNRFVFLHRYMYGGKGRRTRMLIADIDGSNLQVIDGWQKYAWSHFGWKGDDAFVMYAREQKQLAKSYNGSSASKNASKSLKTRFVVALRTVYRKTVSKLIPSNFKSKMLNKMGYQLYERDAQGQFVLKKTYSTGPLSIDGHPSFTPDGRYMITDTYADDKKYRHLLVLDTETDKLTELGKFYSPFWGTPASCDLHPKLSKDANRVVIDTACYGIHRMMVFDLAWDKIREVIG